MSRDLAPILPSSVVVTFEPKRCSGSDETPAIYAKSVTLADAGYPHLEGHPGRKHFRDAAPATYETGETGDPHNKVNLDKLALQIAKDYYAWRMRAYDRVYNGIVAFEGDGFADTVEWTYHAARCETRAVTGPFNGDPEELAHVDVDCCGGLDFLGPPIAGTGSGATISKYRLFMINGRLEKCLVGTVPLCPSA